MSTYHLAIVEEENNVLRSRSKRADSIVSMAANYLQHVVSGDQNRQSAEVLLDIIAEYRKEYARH